jgi:hypothetical protein
MRTPSPGFGGGWLAASARIRVMALIALGAAVAGEPGGGRALAAVRRLLRAGAAAHRAVSCATLPRLWAASARYLLSFVFHHTIAPGCGGAGKGVGVGGWGGGGDLGLAILPERLQVGEAALRPSLQWDQDGSHGAMLVPLCWA